MSRNMLIMCEDNEVMRVNFEEGLFEVVSSQLLPFQLRYALREPPVFTTESLKYQVTQLSIVNRANEAAVVGWLAGRTLSLSRKNAKWLYNLLKVSQQQDNVTKAKLAITCHAVSVLDNYWIKLEGSTESWKEMNIRKNPLNEVVAQVALHGKSLTLQGSLTTPEYTTNGAYAKAWRRREDGLWLYKKGAEGNTEARIEIMCSNLLDKMNVDHVHYEAAEDDGIFVCACPCMTNDNLSILPGMDFVDYCTRQGLDADTEMLSIDAGSIYKMSIVDYLISNRDRHGQNWGFFFDAHSCEILRCHSLFDHNNAFDLETMQNKDATYVFPKENISMRAYAKRAMQKVDFHFTAPIERSDFITQRQYDSFMSRADELGIETIVEKPSIREQYFAKYGMVDSQEEVDRLLQLFGVSSESLLWEKVERDLL